MDGVIGQLMDEIEELIVQKYPGLSVEEVAMALEGIKMRMFHKDVEE